MRLIARFRDDTLITRQQVGVLPIQQMLTKEGPENLRPGDDGVEKSLDGSVAAAFLCPARQSEHRHSTDDRKHGREDPA